MAQAILKGMVKGGAVPPAQISAYDTDAKKLEEVRPYGVVCADSAEALIDACEILILAVKPNVVSSVLDAHRARLNDKSIVSIAAGWSTERLAERLHPSTRILRTMPNTPALVGKGMTALSKSHTLTPEDADLVARVFESVGRVAWIEERLMEAVTAVSGSGPAYVFIFIEAMADGGVLMGLPRAQALEMAAQTVLGASQMVLTTGLHPGALKDMVCSPGGTTIEAVRSLENDAFRAAVINAVAEACEKAESMKA